MGNGLAVLREHGAREGDWVLVHDAARCLLRPSWVDRLIDAIGKTILQKRVTYDLERQMKGATLLTCSEFGRAVAENV